MRRFVQRHEHAVNNSRVARDLGKLAPGEVLETIDVTLRQMQIYRHLRKLLWHGALSSFAGREEMIEEPLAISKAPAKGS